MQMKDSPLLVSLLMLVGAMLLCGGDPDDTAQVIQGGALLVTSALVWLGWYIGRRMMLGVAGLSEIVRLMEASRKEKPTDGG